MKRSEINGAIRRMEALAQNQGFELPPFCRWTPEEWLAKGRDYNEIRDNMLGWDVTDYGMGYFEKVGFTLITLRNGNAKNSSKYKKPYAEKLLMLEKGQYAPMHFHWVKMEDIINRGGGTVHIRVFNATPDEKFADTDVKVYKDGREYIVCAGAHVRLEPGESITIYPHLYHDFALEPGSSAVLLGEVSTCNDDEHDNRFFAPISRFTDIEEDAPPYRLLCNEYPTAKEGDHV